jgi:hypothetical protein
VVSPVALNKRCMARGDTKFAAATWATDRDGMASDLSM